MLLGHGPIFRDFNFAQDEDAATAVISMQLPLTLVPYDASRELPVSDGDLDALAASGGALKLIADRSRGWLAYWKRDIGQPGFYAFDLAAAGLLLEPASFACARVTASVIEGSGFARLFSSRALIVGPEAEEEADDGDGASATLSYCPQAHPLLKARLLKRIIAGD
jgi:inosine-uridine nucleoside N-ribohydrolase